MMIFCLGDESHPSIFSNMLQKSVDSTSHDNTQLKLLSSTNDKNFIHHSKDLMNFHTNNNFFDNNDHNSIDDS